MLLSRKRFDTALSHGEKAHSEPLRLCAVGHGGVRTLAWN